MILSNVGCYALQVKLFDTICGTEYAIAIEAQMCHSAKSSAIQSTHDAFRTCCVDVVCHFYNFKSNINIPILKNTQTF